MWTLCKELNGAQSLSERDYFLTANLGRELNQTSKVLLRFGRTRHRQSDANLKPLRIEI
jgi:hypothetical protein